MNTTALTLRAFNDLFPDEDAARTWFERARWPDGPICPVCGCVDRACWLRTVRRWECIACRRQFTVTAGTPMHRTHLPLLTWAQAIYLIVVSSKGVSAVKLSEMLGVSYETAWHLGHRIRAMMAEDNPLLANVVEIDETYAGAPPRKRAKPEHTDDDRDPPPNPKGRVLNRLVAQGKPKELVLERLDFRHAALSKRLNAILRNCGRSIIQAKLKDLEERFGITTAEVNPAYSSQACSCCGYVDKRNRRDQKTFMCLWCGHRMHADLNAAANIEARRARPNGWLFQGKAAILAELVREFGERRVRASSPCRTGSRGAPADPRLTNPYFGGTPLAVVRSAERREASVKSRETQALVAA
jgi:transposase-like protein